MCYDCTLITPHIIGSMRIWGVGYVSSTVFTSELSPLMYIICICMSIFFPLFSSYVCLFVHLSICPSICPPVRVRTFEGLFVCSCAFLSVLILSYPLPYWTWSVKDYLLVCLSVGLEDFAVLSKPSPGSRLVILNSTQTIKCLKLQLKQALPVPKKWAYLKKSWKS